MNPLVVAAAMTALACLLSVVAFKSWLAIAQPDEWLLCVRNGALVRAGVGIHLWRRPDDVIARFTSTVQRVGFAVEALSHERLTVSIEGFILWSVSSDGDAPFRAFQKLGLVNLERSAGERDDARHLLSTPQHRAFQKLLGSAVQRLAASKTLEDLLAHQQTLVADLREELVAFEHEMGIRVDHVELARLRPADQDILGSMATRTSEQVREDAEQARLETSERCKRWEIESEVRLARERAAARRQALEHEQEVRLAQVAHDRDAKLREQEAEHQFAVAREGMELEMARALLVREEVQLAASLDRVRRQAEASRDAMSSITAAEEEKSQAVRDHELATMLADRIGRALEKLPLKDARWISVGNDSPASSMAALVTGLREMLSSGS
jgi:hypothetical protein